MKYFYGIFIITAFLNMTIAFENVPYEYVKNLPNNPEKLLIDVRRIDEIQATGSIPTSINIPLNDLEKVLKEQKETFKSIYGRNFPDNNDEIIFTCRSGARAKTAAEIAEKLEFKNVKVYAGSWLEWSEKEGLSQQL